MKDGVFYSFKFSKCYALKCDDRYLSKDCSTLVDLSCKDVKLFRRFADAKCFLKLLEKRGYKYFYVVPLVSVWSCVSPRRYLMSCYDEDMGDYCIEDMVDCWEDFLMKKGGKNA